MKAFQSLAWSDLQRPFAPWLYRIVTNLSLHWLKRRRFATISIDQVTHYAWDDSGVQVPDPASGPEAQAVMVEIQARLCQEIASMPELVPPHPIALHFELVVVIIAVVWLAPVRSRGRLAEPVRPGYECAQCRDLTAQRVR